MSISIWERKTASPALIRDIRKGVPFFLIGLLLFSAIAAGFHHHADNLPHDDCPVCVASARTPVVSATAGNAPFYGGAVFFETFQHDLFLPFVARALSGTRAPPL
ncbi:MAG: hypothetical protein HZB22_02680 [Deltaproteobacteria bacterium]|nr:hypothetical protein [Deltaproteobacteria bacterium]